MTKDDVVAELALRDLKKRECLLEIIHQPGFKYYTDAGWKGAVYVLLSGVVVANLFLKWNVPAWGYLLFIISAVGLLEAYRLRGRFDALLELHELEKDKTKQIRVASADRADANAGRTIPVDQG